VNIIRSSESDSLQYQCRCLVSNLLLHLLAGNQDPHHKWWKNVSVVDARHWIYLLSTV